MKTVRSKPIKGVLWKELVEIRAKRGSISGRQHPDVWLVRIFFEREDKQELIVRSVECSTAEEGKRLYENLHLGPG